MQRVHGVQAARPVHRRHVAAGRFRRKHLGWPQSPDRAGMRGRSGTPYSRRTKREPHSGLEMRIARDGAGPAGASLNGLEDLGCKGPKVRGGGRHDRTALGSAAGCVARWRHGYSDAAQVSSCPAWVKHYRCLPGMGTMPHLRSRASAP